MSTHFERFLKALLGMPMALGHVALAIWLIVKGISVGTDVAPRRISSS